MDECQTMITRTITIIDITKAKFLQYSDLKSFVENQTVIQIVNAIVQYGLSIDKSINELGSL